MVGAKLDIDCGNPLTFPSLLKDKYEINICNKNTKHCIKKKLYIFTLFSYINKLHFVRCVDFKFG